MKLQQDHHSGADISAKWFDLSLFDEEKNYLMRFQNSSKGLWEAIRWLESLGVEVSKLKLALEPTGRYGELVAEYFYSKQATVLMVQPLKFSRYSESVDMRGKSDAKDARALAQYCRERGDKLRPWHPKGSVELELRDMQLLLRSLTKRSTAIQCQLKCGLKSEFVKASLKEELEQCEERLKTVIKHAIGLINQHPILSADFARLQTIPGIGEQTAALLVTLIDFRQFKSSRALGSFLGLTKKRNQSGNSKGKEGISKRGNTAIRAALFMPARSARMHNPALREFAERLELRGKHDWVIQAAVIRKLVTVAWALVTNEVEFDFSHAEKQKQVYSRLKESPI